MHLNILWSGWQLWNSKLGVAKFLNGFKTIQDIWSFKPLIANINTSLLNFKCLSLANCCILNVRISLNFLFRFYNYCWYIFSSRLLLLLEKFFKRTSSRIFDLRRYDLILRKDFSINLLLLCEFTGRDDLRIFIIVWLYCFLWILCSNTSSWNSTFWVDSSIINFIIYFIMLSFSNKPISSCLFLSKTRIRLKLFIKLSYFF